MLDSFIQVNPSPEVHVKLLWLTDCHFLLDVPALRRSFEEFVLATATVRPDAVLLGGDMCTGAGLDQVLTAFRQIAPTYCVVGNHEFLGSFVAAVQAQIEDLVSKAPGIIWLSHVTEPIWLTDGVALIGTDSWGDARAGDLSARNLRRRGHQLLYDQVEDIRLIWESCKSDTVCIARELQAFLQSKGNEAATHLDRVGRIAAQTARLVVILLHAPPFPKATLYRRKEDPNGMPFFCAMAAGDVLRRIAESYPDVQFLVLAGHTHCEVDVQILRNLRVLVHDPSGTGAASRWAVLDVGTGPATYKSFVNSIFYRV